MLLWIMVNATESNIAFDKDSEEERLLREHLEATHEHLIAINKIINKEFYD